MAFYVGQKVVCIDAEGILRPDTAFGLEALPALNEVYTVRAVVLPDGETPCLLLEEIRNEPADYEYGKYEFAFIARRFRPVVEPDISIFQRMLSPTPTKERVTG
jgi:hypothetical protein